MLQADPAWEGESDEQIVVRVQRGEAQAFGALFDRHQGRITRFLFTLGVPESEVDDLVGETFCRALDRIDRYDAARNSRYLSYLYAIARNLAMDRLRRKTPQVSGTDLEEDWDAPPHWRRDAMLEDLARLEQVALVRQALEELSTSDREILALAYDQGMTSQEIMEVTGKPSISAVTTHVYKAMQKLRHRVRQFTAGMEAR
ncbi:MAG TPA: sigma-70 family RNA polymerase sigma factor [Armatimonadota bacterium]|jgi:RNA polymerase sigma-70 factor (ECF subfamily)